MLGTSRACQIMRFVGQIPGEDEDLNFRSENFFRWGVR